MLDALQYTNYTENINYVFETWSPITGGFSKWPDCSPDPLHTYMAVCGLSMVNYPSFLSIHPALVISNRAADNLKRIHELWAQ